MSELLTAQREKADTPSAQERVVLEARAVAKDYNDGTRVLRVLSAVDLQVRAGEIISIVGASGAGKSTLLHLFGALDRVTSGEVRLCGQNLSALSRTDLAQLRARRVGFIFQFHHLLTEFTALENVLIPGLILGQSEAELRKRATALLESVGLAERMTHRPTKLSGGEQQRVALARALMNNPDLILADEPTGNLDTKTAQKVIELLWGNARRNNSSLVIVTHEPEIARQADRCLRLREGKLFPEE